MLMVMMASALGVLLYRRKSHVVSHSLSYEYGSYSTRTNPTLQEWVSGNLISTRWLGMIGSPVFIRRPPWYVVSSHDTHHFIYLAGDAAPV